MVVTLSQQQYNVGEKPTVLLYTYITNRHAGTPEKQKKNKNNVVHLSSNMVVIIYCYIIGCKDKATTWYLNGGFPEGSNLGSTV